VKVNWVEIYPNSLFKLFHEKYKKVCNKFHMKSISKLVLKVYRYIGLRYILIVYLNYFMKSKSKLVLKSIRKYLMKGKSKEKLGRYAPVMAANHQCN
jgi:mannose/fructose/N-acetylgalactosamine-specific phosphotransferase system component IIC